MDVLVSTGKTTWDVKRVVDSDYLKTEKCLNANNNKALAMAA